MAVFRIERTRDYTVMSNHHLKDTALSLKAKGLLSMIDGYVLQLDLPELKELVSLLRRSSNNLNQLTRRVHETGRFYDADLEDLRQGYERLWSAAGHVLSQLSKLQ